MMLKEKCCPADLEAAWGRRIQNTPSLLPSLVPQKGRFSLMREVLTKGMTKKARDKSERRNLIEDKGSEKKNPIPSRDSQEGFRRGLGACSGRRVLGLEIYQEGAYPRGNVQKRAQRGQSVAQHVVWGAQVSAWGPQSFPILLQPTPLGSGEMGGGQETQFQPPLALGGRTAVLRSCWGLGGAAADLI